MAGKPQGKSTWLKKLAGGLVAIGAAAGLHAASAPGWLVAALEAVGGLAVVFASCELMILSVEGIGQRLRWNDFVAGSIAGIASNIPEVVMLGFIIANAPRMGFIVVALTLHTGALAFGIYSGMLPRDASGHASLPGPLVKLSTDLYAGAAGVFLATGLLMLVSFVFSGRGAHDGPTLSSVDLYVMGAFLLIVQVVAVRRLISTFSGADAEQPSATKAVADEDPPSVTAIALYGAGGTAASVVGGHAVGAFAETLVTSLAEAGYSPMLGALLLSVFACSGAIAMIATAHMKQLYDVALANASGWMTQMAFLVMPIALILEGAFAQLGITPPLPGGGALIIDMETTSVFLLGFPPLLVLWKAVQDDGKVNWVETATMLCVFGLTVYFLASR